MSKIGSLIPKPIKNAILWVARRPEKIKVAIYRAARTGKIPFPDKAFVKWDYKIHTGQTLNLKKPTTFNEKLQWMKLYYHNPLMTTVVDKYDVREYVKEKAGEDILISCYGIYDCWDEINFDSLPDQFVIKCTHDSGSVVLCRDKSALDMAKARAKIEAGLARNQFYLSREWPYKNLTPRIIIEEFLAPESLTPPSDYKFFCFHGKPTFIMYCADRTESSHKEIYMDMNWEPLPFAHGYPILQTLPPKPSCFEEMKSYAIKLSQDFPHVRVDLYDVNNRIYFGELTMFSHGARSLFDPPEYDRIYGDMITLPSAQK